MPTTDDILTLVDTVAVKVSVAVEDTLTINAGLPEDREVTPGVDPTGPSDLHTIEDDLNARYCLAYSLTQLQRASTGRLYLTIREAEGLYYPIRVYYSDDDGVTWDVETAVTGIVRCWRISTCLDADDNLHIAYYDNQGGYRIKYVRRNANGTYESIETVADIIGATYTGIGVTTDGRVYIAWDDYGQGDGAPYLHYSIRDLAGSWSAVNILFDPNGSSVYDIRVVVDSSDNVHVLWHWVDYDAEPNRVYRAYHSYHNGTVWSTPVNILEGIDDVDCLTAILGHDDCVHAFIQVWVWNDIASVWEINLRHLRYTTSWQTVNQSIYTTDGYPIYALSASCAAEGVYAVLAIADSVTGYRHAVIQSTGGESWREPILLSDVLLASNTTVTMCPTTADIVYGIWQSNWIYDVYHLSINPPGSEFTDALYIGDSVEVEETESPKVETLSIVDHVEVLHGTLQFWGDDSIGLLYHETKLHPQTSNLYMVVRTPRVIWRGTITQARADEDDYVIHVTGDDVAGFSIDDFMPHLTAWVGTAVDGKDHGMCRVRYISDAGASLHVSADMSCVWEVGDYISITDEHKLWPRPHVVEVDEEDMEIAVAKDHDIPSSERAEFPVPIMGPPPCAFRDVDTGLATVLYYGAKSYLVQPDSNVYDELHWDAHGITDWNWWFEGGTPETSQETNPTVTYDTPGDYIVRLEVTGHNGKTYRGFRNVFIRDRSGSWAPISDIDITEISGSLDSHGWEAQIRTYGDTAIPNESQVVIFSEDYFDGQIKESCYGFPGRENIKLVGMAAVTSIDRTHEVTAVDMSVFGYQDTIMEEVNYAVYFTQVDEEAPGWSLFDDGLTVRKALYHLIEWHWTLFGFMDVYLPDDHNNYLPGQSFPEGSLGTQLDDFCQDIQARWGISREGGLWIFSWPNTLAYRWRYDIHPTILVLNEDDITHLKISRRNRRGTCRVRVEGVMANGDGYYGTTIATIPGNIKSYIGEALTLSNQVIGHPDQAEELARMVHAEESRTIESVELEMAGNFSLCDCAPCSRVLVTVHDSDHGIEWSQKPFWVSGMKDTVDAQGGYITTTLTLLPEVYPTGRTYSEHDSISDIGNKSTSSGTGAISGVVRKLSLPKSRVVPALMGIHPEKIEGPQPGLVYVRLYGDAAQIVLADCRNFKAIYDRPVWVQVTDGSNYAGFGGRSLYTVVDIREGAYEDAEEDSGFTTRLGVMAVPGSLIAGAQAAAPLDVMGVRVKALGWRASVRVAPTTANLVATIKVNYETLATVVIAIGSVAASGTLDRWLTVGDVLDVIVLEGGAAMSLTVCVSCRELGL